VVNVAINPAELGKWTWGDFKPGETWMLKDAANGKGFGDNGRFKGAGLFRMDLGPAAFRKKEVLVGEAIERVNMAADISFCSKKSRE
jgi:hypothetical protein